LRKPSVEKGNDRILFSRVKHVAQKSPHRSPRFKAWLKGRGALGDFHHVCGSVHKLKSTDLLAVIVPHKSHMEGEESIEWLVQQLPQGIENLLRYAQHLEERVEVLEGLYAEAQMETMSQEWALEREARST